VRQTQRRIAAEAKLAALRKKREEIYDRMQIEAEKKRREQMPVDDREDKRKRQELEFDYFIIFLIQ
jgi:hypothetical protein